MTTPFEDLSLARAFVGIVAAGSISAAARTMKTPQPTLSRRLRMLEERCGGVLLQRDTHRMRLTELGRRLHEDALTLLELAEAATLRLGEERQALRGHLRIFATIDSGQSMVTRLIACFLQEHPGVTAELGYTNRPLRMIEEGFDAGVVAGGLADDRVVALAAGRVRRYPVASPALVQRQPAATRPADLASWPWLALVGRQFGEPGRVELRAGPRSRASLPVSPIFTSEGVISLREAVLLGTGIAVLPDWLVGEDLAYGRLVRVLPQWQAPELPVHVIHPGGRPPVRVRAFVDFAVESMKAALRVVE